MTGAASGIGDECARKLARDGATVVIADLNLANGADGCAGDRRTQGGKALAVVDGRDAAKKRSKRVSPKPSTNSARIDVLVSNAGIQIVNPIEDYAFADWKKMLAIHLDGAFLTTKAAIRHMYASGKGGSIIYMGSVHSHEASKLKSAYVTAKHGLLGLARVVAKEGGPRGVRANVVCPGFVRTPLVDKQIPEQAQGTRHHRGSRSSRT